MATTNPLPFAALSPQGWDPRLHVFRAGDEVDTCVLTTQRYLIVVDTMATPELAHALLDAVRPALAGRQLLVINTHADYDHCWGNAVFAAPDGPYPAPIVGHALAAARLRGAAARHELQLRQAQDARFAHVRLVPPTLTFTQGLRIDGGDLTLELLPTPGHTPDHVALWVPELRLVVAGDAAEHPFPCAADAAGLPLLRRSLAQLAQLQPEVVLPCHGGAADAGLLTRNLAYFATLERHVRQARAAGQVATADAVRADLPDVIGFPVEAAVAAVGGDPGAIPALYRQFHQQNAQAMVGAVLEG